MVYVIAWWDVSWWIGILFSLGSAVFLMAGCIYWVPLAYPGTRFSGKYATAGGVLSFGGSTLFVVGGVLLVVEATNEKLDECFG